ncbi:hypothetical protein [Kineosporia succinea]|uniref:Lipoprotein n=1 Tax=Kineosporia succinea TaxID=84632 RepID=A0ABT9P4T7_9ACTN|nr:hypothetical protein [Kineosporia succinea]MDP9827492.1 hypothetical protein [Kineosporia succinea]
MALALSACGGTSGGDASNPIVSSSLPTGAAVPTGTPSASSPGEAASPTVSVFARTSDSADQVLAGASEAIRNAPGDVLATIAFEIEAYHIQGPVKYAPVTKSSVFTKRMKWFTDEELDGITYFVMLPFTDWQGKRAYLLATSRAPTDFRKIFVTEDNGAADLSSLGEIQSLTVDDLDSVSDWRPFLSRPVWPSEMRTSEDS